VNTERILWVYWTWLEEFNVKEEAGEGRKCCIWNDIFFCLQREPENSNEGEMANQIR
jgi:hypothetical protein